MCYILMFPPPVPPHTSLRQSTAFNVRAIRHLSQSTSALSSDIYHERQCSEPLQSPIISASLPTRSEIIEPRSEGLKPSSKDPNGAKGGKMFRTLRNMGLV